MIVYMSKRKKTQYNKMNEKEKKVKEKGREREREKMKIAIKVILTLQFFIQTSSGSN